mgnify:CR=1 FL=1
MFLGFGVDLGRGSSGLGVGGLRKIVDYENVYNYTKWESTFFGTRSEINRLPCLELPGASPLGIWGWQRSANDYEMRHSRGET